MLAQVAQTAPAQVAKAAPAQVLATHAIGAAATELPMAKAMPIQQQSQGQALAQQVLPQPVYPPQSAMVQVPVRPQAQQLAAPPGLGTNLERTQAAQIQQMQQELAQLHAQLRATQAPAPQRQSSQSPSGNWDGMILHNPANGMATAGKTGETAEDTNDGIPV